MQRTETKNTSPARRRKQRINDGGATNPDRKNEEEGQEQQQLLPPHVLRLLKLLREGTAEHGAQAAARLTAMAAAATATTTSNNNNNHHHHQLSPVQLWDILGRLCTDLTSAASWKCRSSAAVALEGCASHLPEQDQNEFLMARPSRPPPKQQHIQKDYNQHDKEGNHHDNNENNSSSNDGDGNYQYFKLKHLVNDIETVLQEGRELYVAAPSEYEDDEEQYFIATSSSSSCRERQERMGKTALQHLDRTAVANKDATLVRSSSSSPEAAATEAAKNSHRQQENNGSGEEMSEFLHRRCQLQRGILAARMGLGSMGKLLGDAAVLPDMITTEEMKSASATGNDGKKIAPNAKRKRQQQPTSGDDSKIPPKKNKRRRKGKKTGNNEKGGKAAQQPSMVPTLLVMEITKQQQRADPYQHGNRPVSHRNPQTLLATELQYRMLDDKWYARHGALLGTLSLIRAWKKTAAMCAARARASSLANSDSSGSTTANSSQENDEYSSSTSLFGAWPEEILVQSICVLALDRFGDFAGALEQEETGILSSLDTAVVMFKMTSSGGVVAPVRETAGQLVAVLFCMAPKNIQCDTFEILTKMASSGGSNNDGIDWEVRHGALQALKYIVVVTTQDLLSVQQGDEEVQKEDELYCRHRSESSDWLQAISRVAVEHLLDESDDVQSVAAQILALLLVKEYTHFADIASVVEIVWETAPVPLWSALCQAVTVSNASSCSVMDLARLCCAFLQIDCARFCLAINGDKKRDSTMGSKYGTNDKKGPVDLGTVLHTLAFLLDSDYASVQRCAIQSIGCVVDPIYESLTGTTGDDVALDETSKHKVVKAYCDAVERLFKLYFVTEKSNSSNKTGCTIQLLDAVWNRLADVGGSIRLLGQTQRELLFQLQLKLIYRFFDVLPNDCDEDHYFSRNNSDTTDNVEFGSLVPAARAISYFFLCLTKCDSDVAGRNADNRNKNKSVQCLLQLALTSFLHSPRLFQCEAACLLYRYLSSSELSGCQNNANVSRILLDNKIIRDQLNEFLQDTNMAPLCLWIDQDAVETASKIYNDAFITSSVNISSMLQEDNTEDKKSRPTIETTCSALQKRQQRKQTIVINQTSMRLFASIASAVLASCERLNKVTLLARPLVTSLKNEKIISRQIQTCSSLARLLDLIDQNPTSKTKILNTICESAAREVIMVQENQQSQHNDENLEGCDAPLLAAVHVLQILVEKRKAAKTLEKLPPLWAQLELLTSPEGALNQDQKMIVSATALLRAVSGGLTQSSPLTQSMMGVFVPTLVKLACEYHCNLQIRGLASSTLKVLCVVDSPLLLDRSVENLLPYLRDRTGNAEDRLAACQLLQDLIEKDSAMNICPFVRQLLPIAMSLMTDPCQECSSAANRIFASLVRVAPLVRQQHLTAEIPTTKTRSKKESTEDGGRVIDHLILGKPLPSCKLPSCIQDTLNRAGVTLRDYQMEGITWLRFLQTVNLNGALCDDMGLGKTLQALIGIALAHYHQASAFDESQKSDRIVSLVVCPASLVGHWVAETQKFFGELSVFRPLCLSGNSAHRRKLLRIELSKSNIVVTSYAALRSDIDSLAATKWQYCVLDEGHLLKNPKTATARALRRVKAHHKLILSGTPVQNNVNELWAIFDFLMPNFLGSTAFFSKEYARVIAKSQLPNASASCISEGMEKLKVLHQQVLPFLLRREKGQVLQELPPKNVTVLSIPMSELQSKIYEKFCSSADVQRSLASLQQGMNEPSKSSVQVSENGNITSIGKDVFKSLLFLRLVCTHPSLVFSKREDASVMADPFFNLDASGKLVGLLELLRDAGIHDDEFMAADNDSSLFYCDDNDNKTTASKESYSGIVESADDIAMKTSFAGRVKPRKNSKCLIFAQFTQSLDIIEELLFKPHMPSLRYLRLDGRVPKERRAGLAEAFNCDIDVRVMLLTTRVGGLGLNLTGADTVIFLENDYNPFVDLQAMDRAHRIGQKRTVNVFRLVMKDSIEEKIMKIQGKKVAMSNEIVNTDNSTMFSMGTDRVLDIFTFRSDQETTNASDQQNLEEVVDRYCDEYSNLSIDKFVEGFRSVKKETEQVELIN